ncbi:MAG: DHH family phosphoesterase [Clostridia bacterium]|nr:DHH family phosphoesterase [Clostridia bacterium]
MTDYKCLSKTECKEILESIDSPLIVMHANPDADTVGCAAALADIYSMLGKKASYACTDRIPDRLTFLLEGVGRAENFEGKTPIAIDIASPKTLGSYEEIFTKKYPPALMIDHHELGVEFADYYKVKGASSAGEVLFGIVELLVSEGKITLTKELASHLFAAISSDTGAFRFSNATPETYRVAARLIEAGVDHAAISHRLYFSKSEAQIRAEGAVARRIKTAYDGKVAYAAISIKDMTDEGLEFPDFETGIEIVRSIIGAEIAFIVKERAEGVYKISLRSLGADVSMVAGQFGGGGHLRAAACTIEADSASCAAEKILTEIGKEILWK